MKMHSVVSGLLLSLFVVQAQASRQAITCVEVSKNKGDKLKVYLDFDPAVSQETIWSKDAQGNGVIITYKLGSKDGNGLTSARVGLEIPSSEFKKPYSGRFLLTDFYDINTDEKTGGYAYKFDGQPYHGFHGHDKDQRWDTMVYIPSSIIGQNAKSFPGLTTIQMDLMDQGYYHIDLNCSSVIK